VAASSVSDDLEWWRANRGAADVAAMGELLARLRAWKVEHDESRARQSPAFLQMTWDWVFGDEDGRVVDAIGELEQALSAQS
jgi:hypothetical protein